RRPGHAVRRAGHRGMGASRRSTRAARHDGRLCDTDESYRAEQYARRGTRKEEAVMSAIDLESWRDAAAALPDADVDLGVPFDGFRAEAIAVAKFHAKPWQAQRGDDGGVVLPGHELAVGTGPRKTPLTSKTGKEIRSLQAAARH